MNLFRKIERGLTALAIAPLMGIEKKGRDRKREERLKRLERQRQRYN